MANPTITKDGLEERFVTAFEMHDGHTLNGTNAAIQGARKEAIGRFRALGFPRKKDEAWKYTDVSRLLKHDYQLALGKTDAGLSADDVAAHAVPGLDAYTAVLVNGRFHADLSTLDGLPEGVVVTGFGEATARHTDVVDRHFGRYTDVDAEPFAALNTAFTLDGLFIHVPANTVVDKPIQVIRLVTGDKDLFVQPRNLYVFERGAEASVVETHAARSSSKMFTNALDEIYVGPNASVDRYIVQDEHADTATVGTTEAYQEQDSRFAQYTFTFGGGMVRNNVRVLPDGENITSNLWGLFMPRGTEHVDNHTLIDHAKPHCESNELYKGILDDKSKGVFNGKVFVRQDAQQINAFQQNQTILLSDDAKMNAKPELEIYADDVKCSHGATTGQLDKEALFYLRSRGLSEGRARALMLLAFARDVVDTVKLDELRHLLDARISARFEEGK